MEQHNRVGVQTVLLASLGPVDLRQRLDVGTDDLSRYLSSNSELSLVVRLRDDVKCRGHGQRETRIVYPVRHLPGGI